VSRDDWHRLYEATWPLPQVGDVVQVRGELVVLTERGQRPATREERRWWLDQRRGTTS
jgi:hypothetical protein